MSDRGSGTARGGLASAVGFLTVVPSARTPDRTTLAWFPVIGAGIGVVLAGTWQAGAEVWSPAVAAALVVAVDLALTGLLHADGLADSADGLLPHLPRERRLAIMAAPDVGAFALAIVPTVLLLRWVALAGDTVDPAALVAVWAITRTLLAVTPAVVGYARTDGLASPFLDGARRWFVVWLVPAAVGLGVVEGVSGVVAAAVAVATVAGVVALATRRIGGFTGDVLGAAAVLAETTALLTLAAST